MRRDFSDRPTYCAGAAWGRNSKHRRRRRDALFNQLLRSGDEE
jgi:hypothetical protein